MAMPNGGEATANFQQSGAVPDSGRGSWNRQNGGHAAPSQPSARLPAPSRDPSQPLPISVSSLNVGDEIDVFHRYAQDPNGYFMVQHSTSGLLHPSVGRTDGWTSAKVSEAWNIRNYSPHNYKTWVEIQWTHPHWYNRRGHRLDTSNPSMITQRVMPEQIRQRVSESEASPEALARPTLSLLHVRWGGEQPVNPVTEGAGGWGQIGSTPSDNYINGLEDQIFRTLGPTYEIYSCFIQGSEELQRLSAPLLRHLLRGACVGGLYFLWPISFQDGHEFPAYVDRQQLFQLMVNMEATGIPTRFPHQSHLYRIFASKEWTAQMCLHPLLKVPLTTQVARQAVAHNPGKAAGNAMAALQQLSEARSQWNTALGFSQEPPIPVNKGVAKLGWSWEAMDVTAWRNRGELTRALASLGEQPGSLVDLVFVQEWVEFDVEMRHFIVEPNLADPESLKPKQIVYTVFKSKEQGSFRNFDRYDRQGCLQNCYRNDDTALADAEDQALKLIHRWLEWLQAQTHELPTVVRFDIMAKRIGQGRSSIMTGELTELGGCFLGWPKGPQVVFG
eukprot:CAMPEP_0206480434 /NCGR_PEP_ID=MMETSP0324_2-20121206/37327_1 /ASSEMBLY_ACC=CAM_ASM_000836 /TAXON_ID=2866 /ORGANISM="Crypthecodinium cohnii, Strain Seligo" /LENGTH=557 /DNA_ID=CAMNT_0053957291 /DNA_START=86 /DNA_END=1756 /DNA_ORIENTATION=+